MCTHSTSKKANVDHQGYERMFAVAGKHEHMPRTRIRGITAKLTTRQFTVTVRPLQF